MTDIMDQMVVAMNEHDLECAASLMHRDYRSEQPAHPSLAFIVISFSSLVAARRQASHSG